MSTRPWRFPDLRNGTTIHHLTDTHFGDRFFTPAFGNKILADMETLRVSHAGHVHTGDMVHWRGSANSGPEDSLYVEFRDAMKAADGKPFAEIPGNHDLGSYGSDVWRTKEQWAATVGAVGGNSVTHVGDMTVIGLSPDVWKPDPAGDGYLDPVLSQATLDWLDAQLTANGSRPVWLASHVPPSGQYSNSTATTVQPEASVDALVAAHPAVVGWLSGHWHVNPDATPSHVRTMTQGGRTVFAVNAPAGGGLMSGVSQADQQWKSPALSMFVTFLGDAVDVRWRNHNAGQWVTASGAYEQRLVRV